uniref:Not1 protein n=1 Tax=Phallusia mammillata TaxID=59560 RepID=A0A6F9DAF1_9ASCI|nr:not1 protein [Phallusia mammillata]
MSACCNNADGCNTLTVATQTARQCLVGTTTQVGSAAATGSLVLQHCASGEMCGRKETTTTSGGK